LWKNINKKNPFNKNTFLPELKGFQLHLFYAKMNLVHPPKFLNFVVWKFGKTTITSKLKYLNYLFKLKV